MAGALAGTGIMSGGAIFTSNSPVATNDFFSGGAALMGSLKESCGEVQAGQSRR
jgi:hypothetical protein